MRVTESNLHEEHAGECLVNFVLFVDDWQ